MFLGRCVQMEDFERALDEVRPAFGADEEQFSGCKLNGIISWDFTVDLILNTGRLLAQQVATSARTPLVSLLLEGESNTGLFCSSWGLVLRPFFVLLTTMDILRMAPHRQVLFGH